MRIAFVGTELAGLRAESGALERAVLSWAAGLERAGHATGLFDAGPGGPPLAQIEAFGAEVVILNNRPSWALVVPEALGVLQILHNYDDAWSTGDVAPGDQLRGLERPGSVILAVSDALSRYIESTYLCSGAVGRAVVSVEEVFFATKWQGGGGPVLFPNRLLEKKGVRFFLQLAEELSPAHTCQLFSHTAPFEPPSPEQAELLGLARSCPFVEVLEPPGTREEMARAYAEAGVVLCPSVRPEGLGLVALEAQAVGAPLVTSGLGGLDEVTFPPNESVGSFEMASWTDAVRRVLLERDRGKAALEVKSRFNEQRATDSLLAGLSELI
jgi:hypothetical protein